MATTSRSYVLKKHFDGLPAEHDFEIVETTLLPIADGEFLIESLYLSVDPYMRINAHLLKLGTTMSGTGVGRVTQSKNENYPVGCFLLGPLGWCTHVIPEASLVESNAYQKIPTDVDNRDLSHFIGVLGLTGLTAYFGLLDFCNPQAGETVFVNAAAGAVGSIVGQLAKIKGCHVVGCAGSDAKLEYLREIGFDEVFNYKTVDFEKALSEFCPKGIDCFFENVGGKMFDITLKHMNKQSRITICGTISSYNEKEVPKGPYIHMDVIFKEIKIQGILVSSFHERFGEGITTLRKWLTEGKLKAREHVVQGFENMSKAFIGLFSGERIGKVVIKLK